MKAEKKEINIQIGKRLQTARENSGYTQEVFAETLDVGVEHYRKIESGVYGLQLGVTRGYRKELTEKHIAFVQGGM